MNLYVLFIKRSSSSEATTCKKARPTLRFLRALSNDKCLSYISRNGMLSVASTSFSCMKLLRSGIGTFDCERSRGGFLSSCASL